MNNDLGPVSYIAAVLFGIAIFCAITAAALVTGNALALKLALLAFALGYIVQVLDAFLNLNAVPEVIAEQVGFAGMCVWALSIVLGAGAILSLILA